MDNSISQSIENQDGDGLNVYKNIILGLINDRSDRISFITNDFSRPYYSNLTNSDLNEELQNIDYSYSQSSIVTIVDRMRGNADSDNYFIFSDMQGWSVEDLNVFKDDSLRNYYFVLNELVQRKNVYVDTAYIVPNPLDYGSIILTVKLSFSSFMKEGKVITRLLSGGRQVASVVNDITQSDYVNFTIPSNSFGEFEIQLIGDEVEFDNSLFFTLSKRNKIAITLISKNENLYLSKVYANSLFFDFDFMSSSMIDFEILTNSDFIIIDDLQSIPNGILRQLTEAKLLVIPSDSIDLNSYSEGIGIKINRSVDEKVYESMLDSDNPFFTKTLTSKTSSLSLPNGTNSLQFEDGVEEVMGLRNGDSFLVKLLNKDVYVFSCPLTSEYTNLAEHSLFLPLMYQLAMNSMEENNGIYFYPNDLRSIRITQSDIPIKLVGIDSEVIPDFSKNGNSMIFRIPNSIPPGFYLLMQGVDTLSQLAVNLSKKESEMEGLSFSSLQEFTEDAPHLRIVNLQDSSKVDFNNETSSSLWKYALILAMLFILTESLLHKYVK